MQLHFSVTFACGGNAEILVSTWCEAEVVHILKMILGKNYWCADSPGLQVYKSASLQVCKSASLQVCKSAGLQVCRSASLQVCKSAVCKCCTPFLKPCFILVVTSFFHSFPVFLNFSFLSCQYLRVTRAVLCLHGCIFFKSQNKQHAYLLYVRKMQNVCFIWAILKQITECDFEKVWKCCAFTLMKWK